MTWSWSEYPPPTMCSNSTTNSPNTAAIFPISSTTEEERREIRWEMFIQRIKSNIQIHTKLPDKVMETYVTQLGCPKEQLRMIETHMERIRPRLQR